MFDPISLNAAEPVNQQIYRILRRKIITCTILPGVFLSEKEIGALFTVSRQPVREAFIKLSEAGLVTILPQRGTFVSKISKKKVMDGQFIREVVECAVIARAVNEISAQDILLLEQNLTEQKQAVLAKNTAIFLMKDDEFHQIIMNIIDCSMAWETLENIKAMMDRVRFLTLDCISPTSSLMQQHENILTALKQRDQEGAIKMQREHLQEILHSIDVVQIKNSDWFID